MCTARVLKEAIVCLLAGCFRVHGPQLPQLVPGVHPDRARGAPEHQGTAPWSQCSESHAACLPLSVEQVDTSGTAKALVASFQKLGLPFNVEDIEKVRDSAGQRGMGVPGACTRRAVVTLA